MLEMLFAVAVVLMLFLAASFFIVAQQTLVVIERFGRFHRIAEPGLNFMIPFIEQKKGRVSLRILQLDIPVETKTQDNVFVHLVTSVQYKILPKGVYNAFYKLESPPDQIRAFIFDSVRAQVPKLILDDVFSKKDTIATVVRNDLQDQMNTFGFEIMKVLITDIQPDSGVKDAMNEINTAQRLRVAAQEKGEAEKVMRVKQAEAEAEASILHGKGLAGQRHAIVEGLSSSVEDMMKAVPETNAQSVMEIVMLTQYMDMLKDVGGTSRSNVVFVPHAPKHLGDLGEQMREVIFSSLLLDPKNKPTLTKKKPQKKT